MATRETSILARWRKRRAEKKAALEGTDSTVDTEEEDNTSGSTGGTTEGGDTGGTTEGGDTGSGSDDEE